MPVVKKITDAPQLTGSFNDWLANAKKGDRVIYHTGIYAGGIESAYAREAFQKGLVALVARAQSNPDPKKARLFDFIAERCTVRHWNYETLSRGQIKARR